MSTGSRRTWMMHALGSARWISPTRRKLAGSLSVTRSAAAARIAAGTGGSVDVLTDARAACQEADVIATDVWTSMGQDSERAQRLAILGSGDSYQLDAAKLALGRPGCLVLHCLPAHRGEEITDAVLDGPRSLILDQAENRLHAQKGIIVNLLGGEQP